MEEVFVERPVMSCGHLCLRMDAILPVGNTPRIHMVEGPLTSSGCPERCSCFDFAKRAWAEGGSGTACCCSGLGWVSLTRPSSSLLPSALPLHLSGPTSSGAKVSFPGISGTSLQLPNAGVSGNRTGFEVTYRDRCSLEGRDK